MKYVVTGGAGLIGVNLLRKLLELGKQVRAIDNFSRGNSKNLEGLPVEVVYADLRSYQQALKAVEGADVVYHLAARVGSIDFLHGSKEAELEALQSNLTIDANVFRACREAGVGKIIYSSSVAVYPIDKQQRFGAVFKEEDIYPLNPEGGYGWSKLMGEIQLGMMENCRSAIARIFETYGECCEYEKAAQVVPALIRKAINYPNEDFVVWGDGKQTRNLLYVDDCVDALLKMEERAAYPPLTLNIGNTETCTIKELAELIVEISGKKIAVKFDDTKPVGPLSRIPSVDQSHEKIHWQPSTPLGSGIHRTYSWIEKQILMTQSKPDSAPPIKTGP